MLEVEDVLPDAPGSAEERLAALGGGKSIWDRARERVAEILAADAPDHLPPAVDRAIRERFPIRLTLEETNP